MFFFFEMKWGRTLNRWEDAESSNNYNVHNATLNKAYDVKLGLVVACRQRWPRFAFHKEDLLFRHRSWNEK